MERPGSTWEVCAECAPTLTDVFGFAGKFNNQTTTRGTGIGEIESLEGRRLLSSVSLSGGALKIFGNPGSSNKLGVYASGSNLVAVHNGQTRTVKASSVSKIVIYGGSKDDSIWIRPGVKRASVLHGYDGNDKLSGGSGRDWIYGGDGNDKLWGNANADKLYGGDGSDKLWGGGGKNTLNGGAGSDAKWGGSSSGTSSSNSSSAKAPKPVITAQRKSVMAGQAIHVHATNSALGSGSPQGALYKWDFGDKGSSYNTLNGFNAAHHYKKPGTYTIRLTITNQAGKTSSTSMKVKVAPNTRHRIYVSKSGSDSNPGTQAKPLKSFNKVATMVSRWSNVEVLFHRGHTFDASANFDAKGDNVVIGAYGSGSNPVIRWTADMKGYPSVISPKGDDITIEGLTFTSSTSNPPQAIRASGDNVTVRGNVFKTLGYAVNANGKPNGLLVQGNMAPDTSGIESYFVWGEGTDHVYLGNKVVNSREEHVIRVVGADRVLVWANDLTNTTGHASGDNTPKGALTLHRGSYYWVARNELNEGPVAIGPLGNGDGMNDKGARFRYGVFDANTFDTKVTIDHGAERIMFKNNVIKSSDTAILIEGYNSKYGRTASDVTIVNNTAINYGSSGRFIKVEDGASGVTLANNLYVAPKLTTGQGATASVYVEDGSLSSFRFIGNNVWASANPLKYAQGGQNYVWPSWSNSSGYRSASEWNKMGVVGTDYFSDVSISGYKPSGSSMAAKAGRAFAGVFHDRNGKIRPSSGTWTAGAIQR